MDNLETSLTWGMIGCIYGETLPSAMGLSVRKIDLDPAGQFL
jgi:hypothetical protein